ncbi:peptide N-acetyl-beta-D-glucosaminyl asparaginase amidase A-domain-containing protein [Mycena floridula]|nr:peptide N-acetyl-beta-D-glucosaminyl asparaginase amidase A-domain-containing protein [Mycena floridula]
MFPSVIAVVCFFTVVVGQLTAEELAPLLDGLAAAPHQNSSLQKRVPLSTNDPTVSPLVSLQVWAPPIVPKGGKFCKVVLLNHTFGGGSFNAPAIVPYIPPTNQSCGDVGKWAAIHLNLSVYSIGTQYDRLGSIYLSHTEIWRTSSAEPTKTGTIWNTVKDVTHFTPLFAKQGDFMMDFSNIIAPDLLLDAVFEVVVTATFYAPTKEFPTPKTSDYIVPLSNLSPTVANYFTIADDNGGTTNVTFEDNTEEVYAEIFCSGNSAEEFWYLNTPDEFVDYFPASTGIIGKGPFREVQVMVDNQFAGAVWPYAVIYTGGITPSNWRPLTAYGAYDEPTYWIDLTPFLPLLLDQESHSITLRVLGQGVAPTINSNWFVSGSLHIRTGTSKTTGKIISYNAPALNIATDGHVAEGNVTVSTKVTASREFKVESLLHTSQGSKTVSFSQSLKYTNTQSYQDNGWVQWGNQSTIGATVSLHNNIIILRDAFTYPLSVFSNYSLFEEQFGKVLFLTTEAGGYGSNIWQTFTRALLPPTSFYKSIHSVQQAKGFIGMDDWPGLRHAINGTGATEQKFAYVAGDATYFRDIAAKNDGFVHDYVWGNYLDGNPPVSSSQIFGPAGGPGF